VSGPFSFSEAAANAHRDNMRQKMLLGDQGLDRTLVIERHSGSLGFCDSCSLLGRHIERTAQALE